MDGFQSRVVFGLFLLLFSRTVFGDSVWDDTYPEIQYGDFKHPEKLDNKLIRILHGIVREVGGVDRPFRLPPQ